MIEGFKIQVTSAELQARLKERVEHHDAKTKHYETQTAALVAGGDSETGHSRDPVRDLRERANTHKAKAELFRFMVEHIIPNETYQLDEQDLARLEIIDRGHW